MGDLYGFDRDVFGERRAYDAGGFREGRRTAMDAGALDAAKPDADRFTGSFGVRDASHGAFGVSTAVDAVADAAASQRDGTFADSSGRSFRVALSIRDAASRLSADGIAPTAGSVASRALDAFSSGGDGTFDDAPREAVGAAQGAARIGGSLRRFSARLSKPGGAAGAAQRRSREIARGLAEGRAVSGMGASQRAAAASRAAAATIRRGAASGGGWLFGIMGSSSPIMPAIVVVVAVLSFLQAITAAAVVAQGTSTSLNGTEQQVAAFLMGKGLDEVHTAAIMGNMFAESGMDPSTVESGGTGIGLCQWSFGRADALRDYASSVDKPWQDVGVQLEFFWSHDIWHTSWSGDYATTRQGRGDPPAGTRVSGSKSAFLATDDLDRAVEEFCFGWERPGTPRLGIRKDAASRYFTALSTGRGEDYAAASAAQRSLVDAALATPSPGEGYCARWVSLCFQRAGYGYPGGNADDMYERWCHSSDRSELRVGMIIAVPTHPHSASGEAYGHVGIYIGDNQVMHNVGSVETWDLDRWIGYYGATSQARWGWASGRDLSAS